MSDESKTPQRAKLPKPIMLEDIKHGFTDIALEILSEYSRYKAIMNPKDFEHWYQEKSWDSARLRATRRSGG